MSKSPFKDSDIAKQVENGFDNATLKKIKSLPVTTLMDVLYQVAKVTLENETKFRKMKESNMGQSIFESAKSILLNEAATLPDPKSVTEKDLKDIWKNMKVIRVTPDEYMYDWYAGLDDKISDKWLKMVKSDRVFSKAYDDGYDGDNEKNPFKDGTLAYAIWDNEYANGSNDS